MLHALDCYVKRYCDSAKIIKGEESTTNVTNKNFSLFFSFFHFLSFFHFYESIKNEYFLVDNPPHVLVRRNLFSFNTHTGKR